ncbi:MAG: NAD(P)-dependent glycerol-3-phosphate dehydrogenase [Thermomicrobiales bacterium]|nr:NAD(P)-dependent glycerol-3-phosphate dehydrogenase [Thermomicrobiales bacterium]MCO5223845.1 NAD(P)-dependent glycerol-3-phosphate dehydrogenase [Thermomicrobiales bacterium]MCO5227409.1 NAD(P)-dependent glycerol-3-phosphate dehydrogenase [Thermomicrobiales bacterium]
MQTAVSKLVVIGSGAWGTTLALVADRAGTETTLLARNQEDYEVFSESRRHPRSLPGIALPDSLMVSMDTERVLADADIVLLAIPSQKLRTGVLPIAPLLNGKIVASAAKGIEIGTSLLPTQILQEVLGEGSGASICALSGPNLANEIAQGKPATTVIASTDTEAAATVQRALMGPTFRVYTSPDVIGVQIGGALKNIVAIGAGIGDGLQAGDNAKAAFMTRGIAEIARLGMALGADPLTFAGLSGIGDLICTCSSDLSRNHRVGVRLASGESLGSILNSMGEVAEGVDTTRATVKMARDLRIEMPISEEMYQVMFEGKSPLDAVIALMGREPRHEHI